jgi:dTMP kinase
MPSRPRGWLLAVEGIDGSGKSTLAKSIVDALTEMNISTALVFEPSKGQFGKLARQAATRDPVEAALLFTLDRLSSRKELGSLLATNTVVVTDRSFYSTMAYQGCRLSPQLRKQLMAVEKEVAIVPDLVFWLDGPLEVALRRLRFRKGGPDAIERRRNLKMVGEEYRRLARLEKKRFVKLNFSDPPAELTEKSLISIEKLWNRRLPRIA